jgi:hypothetical protein
MLVLALGVCVGCAADGNKGAWDEFWKDLRGDNMKMRSEPSDLLDRGDRTALMRSSN